MCHLNPRCRGAVAVSFLSCGGVCWEGRPSYVLNVDGFGQHWVFVFRVSPCVTLLSLTHSSQVVPRCQHIRVYQTLTFLFSSAQPNPHLLCGNLTRFFFLTEVIFPHLTLRSISIKWSSYLFYPLSTTRINTHLSWFHPMNVITCAGD